MLHKGYYFRSDKCSEEKAIIQFQCAADIHQVTSKQKMPMGKIQLLSLDEDS